MLTKIEKISMSDDHYQMMQNAELVIDNQYYEFSTANK